LLVVGDGLLVMAEEVVGVADAGVLASPQRSPSSRRRARACWQWVMACWESPSSA
jgi:hypothetical protein